MPEAIPWEALFRIGTPVGLLTLTLWLLWTGRIYTRPQIRELLTAKDRQIEALTADRDHWRSAHGVSEGVRTTALAQVVELTDSVSKLADGAAVSVEVMKALREVAGAQEVKRDRP